LPKINRLTKKKDFDKVFTGGKGVKQDFLLVKAVKNNLPSSRFGFVVSKKVSPKAVVRNRVKRRLRDAVAGLLGELNGSFDVIVISLAGIEKREFLEIQKTVSDSFRKMGII